MPSIVSLPYSYASQPDAGAYIRDAENYLGRITSVMMHTALILLVLRFFIFEPGLTDGISMEPTLQDNTGFVVEKVSAIIFPFKRGDIVQHIEPIERKNMFVKRIIGLPGETVSIKQNAVFITPQKGEEYKLSEPYLRSDVIISVPYRAPRVFVLSDNEYFTLGDNRQNSNDSRAYGPVHRSLITGKILPLVLR